MENNKPVEFGPEIFRYQRAEDESLWLSECFVFPELFDQIINNRSCLVFGHPGSGKTALYQTLRSRCVLKTSQPSILGVDWKPKALPSTDQTGDTLWVQGLIRQLFDAISIATITDLLPLYPDFSSTPDWVKVRLAFLFQTYIMGNINLRLGHYFAKNLVLAQTVAELMNLNQPSDGLFIDEQNPEDIIKEFLIALKYFNVEAIWILADDVQDWILADSGTLTNSLVAFLSTLTLFENTKLSFKLILPIHIETPIAQANGVIRRRVDRHYLYWTKELLHDLIQKRLLMIRQDLNLKKICVNDDLFVWLESIGGSEPREWLDLVFPIIKNYLENGGEQPISKENFEKLKSSYHPRFQLDAKTMQVKIGGRIIPISDLTPTVYNLLTYICKHPGEIITKEELYYFAHRGLDHIPAVGDAEYEVPVNCVRTIDVNLLRIRRAIELDPSNPIFLQTARGHGVRLALRT